MNKKMVIGSLIVCSLIWSMSTKSVADSITEQDYEISDLTATMGLGFGNSLNKYAWSMAYFKDHLYVGTWSITSLVIPSLMRGGAEIWRLEDEATGE